MLAFGMIAKGDEQGIREHVGYVSREIAAVYSWVSLRKMMLTATGALCAAFLGLVGSYFMIRQTDAVENQNRVIAKQSGILQLQIKSQQDALRIRATMGLYAEWHGQAMHKHRIVTDAVIRRFRDSRIAIPTLTLLESAQSNSEGRISVNSGSGSLTVTRDEARSVFAVVHFFEKWAALGGCGRIDRQLMLELMGSFRPWWGDQLIRPLLRDEEGNPDFRGLLARIVRHVFNG